MNAPQINKYQGKISDPIITRVCKFNFLNKNISSLISFSQKNIYQNILLDIEKDISLYYESKDKYLDFYKNYKISNDGDALYSVLVLSELNSIFVAIEREMNMKSVIRDYKINEILK